MVKDQTNGNLDLLLLRVISHGPAHGYATIAALRETSGGVFDLPEGTVYPSLHGSSVPDCSPATGTPARSATTRLRHHGARQGEPGDGPR